MDKFHEEKDSDNICDNKVYKFKTVDMESCESSDILIQTCPCVQCQLVEFTDLFSFFSVFKILTSSDFALNSLKLSNISFPLMNTQKQLKET